MNQGLAPLTSFILPGGCAGAAHLHMARAIVRRAETLMVALAREETINPAALCYINRLSDHLFVMARLTNSEASANAGTGDVLWIPGKDR
jgi:cob(I)alamin adenosyltransferase